jgi:hypothetical protein
MDRQERAGVLPASETLRALVELNEVDPRLHWGTTALVNRTVEGQDVPEQVTGMPPAGRSRYGR